MEGVFACLILPTADFQVPEPVSFRHHGLPNEIQVETVCCTVSKQTMWIRPDLTSLVILRKSCMTKGEIKGKAILVKEMETALGRQTVLVNM